MGTKINLKGQKFGKLFVLEEYGHSTDGKITWRCKCDCGNETIVTGRYLRIGNTRSCGCLKHELEGPRTHGESYTKLYRIWRAMKQRCYQSTQKCYFRYGGRGIKVCDKWLACYENFRDWAINNGYKDGLSIDRIDVNGNYCPENCRWATRKEQMNNKRSNVLIEHNGMTKTIAQWCEFYGITNYNLVRRRIMDYGYTFEEAVTLKPGEKRISPKIKE